MKKINVLVLEILLPSMILAGCTKKSEDIELSDLKTACDYVDAYELLGDSMIKLMVLEPGIHKGREIVTVFEGVSQEEKDRFKVLKEKRRLVHRARLEKYTNEELMECSNYQRVLQQNDEYLHMVL